MFSVQSFSVQRVKARMGEVSASPDLWSERQQTGDEAFWLEEGADEAKGQCLLWSGCESKC